MAEMDALAKESGCTRGALALVGAWREIDDRDVDELVEEIYAARRADTGRHLEN